MNFSPCPKHKDSGSYGVESEDAEIVLPVAITAQIDTNKILAMLAGL